MIDPDDDVLDDASGPIPCGPRDTADDFFCLRYRVWYPSTDCAVRTKFRTSPGCLACDQGAVQSQAAHRLGTHDPLASRLRRLTSPCRCVR
jgi:hypothetical protein